jgi:hypothetical protein
MVVFCRITLRRVVIEIFLPHPFLMHTGTLYWDTGFQYLENVWLIFKKSVEFQSFRFMVVVVVTGG